MSHRVDEDSQLLPGCGLFLGRRGHLDLDSWTNWSWKLPPHTRHQIGLGVRDYVLQHGTLVREPELGIQALDSCVCLLSCP